MRLSDLPPLSGTPASTDFFIGTKADGTTGKWPIPNLSPYTAPVAGAVARTQSAYLAERVSFRDFGTPGQGNDAAIIQAGIDWSANSGKTIWGTDDDWTITTPVRGKSNAKVAVTRGFRLIRAFGQTGTSGLLMNPDITIPLSKFRWEGGTIFNPNPLTLTGNSICLNADDSQLIGIFCDEWSSAGRAALLFGNRLHVYDPWWVTANDGGACRFSKGDDFLCRGGRLASGDDAAQFVPGGAVSGSMFDGTIRRGQYVGVSLYSWNARAMAAVLSSTTAGIVMTGSITGCGFVGCRGQGFTCAWVVDNQSSSGVIEDVTYSNCYIDASLGNGGSTRAAFDIRADTGTGGVRNIRVNGGALTNPYQECLDVRGPGTVQGVTFSDFQFGGPRTAGKNTVILEDSNDVTFEQCTFPGAGNDVVLVGQSGTIARRAHFDRCRFENIENGFYGLRFNFASGGSASRCSFAEKSGQTSANSILVTNNADSIDVGSAGRNSFTEITKAAHLNMPASAGKQNRLFASGVKGSTNGSALRYEDCGEVQTNGTASTQKDFNLPGAVQGAFYEFQVTGTGAICVIAKAGETIRINGSVSTAGGTCTSTAQYSTLKLVAVDNGVWLAFSSSGAWTLA